MKQRYIVAEAFHRTVLLIDPDKDNYCCLITENLRLNSLLHLHLEDKKSILYRWCLVEGGEGKPVKLMWMEERWGGLAVPLLVPTHHYYKLITTIASPRPHREIMRWSFTYQIELLHWCRVWESCPGVGWLAEDCGGRVTSKLVTITSRL